MIADGRGVARVQFAPEALQLLWELPPLVDDDCMGVQTISGNPDNPADYPPSPYPRRPKSPRVLVCQLVSSRRAVRQFRPVNSLPKRFQLDAVMVTADFFILFLVSIIAGWLAGCLPGTGIRQHVGMFLN